MLNEDGMSQFNFSLFSNDHSTASFSSSHSNRELKDANEMQDIFDDTSEMVENYLSVADMSSTLPTEATISNDLRSTDYEGSNYYN